jgi:hypothetical protein
LQVLADVNVYLGDKQLSALFGLFHSRTTTKGCNQESSTSCMEWEPMLDWLLAVPPDTSGTVGPVPMLRTVDNTASNATATEGKSTTLSGVQIGFDGKHTSPHLNTAKPQRDHDTKAVKSPSQVEHEHSSCAHTKPCACQSTRDEAGGATSSGVVEDESRERIKRGGRVRNASKSPRRVFAPTAPVHSNTRAKPSSAKHRQRDRSRVATVSNKSKVLSTKSGLTPAGPTSNAMSQQRSGVQRHTKSGDKVSNGQKPQPTRSPYHTPPKGLMTSTGKRFKWRKFRIRKTLERKQTNMVVVATCAERPTSRMPESLASSSPQVDKVVKAGIDTQRRSVRSCARKFVANVIARTLRAEPLLISVGGMV